MKGDDRFGLQGNVEVRDARRVTFGSESVSTLLMGLATLTALLLTALGLSGGWSWPGVILLLSVPVTALGWAQWLRARRAGRSTKQLGVSVYLALVGLRYFSEILADALDQGGVSFWNVGMVLLAGLGAAYSFLQHSRRRG